MASTVRALTVDQAFDRALQMMSEYSVRGVVQTGTKIEDNKKKRFSLADSAQQEIALKIPIEETYIYSNFKLDTLFGDEAGLNIVEHLNDDVVLMEVVGPASYTFECNATSGTYEVQEEQSEDNWVLLGSAVNFTGTDGQYVTYKANITPSDSSYSVRIVLKGSYPYYATNYTMYDITFDTDGNVAEYGHKNKYALPSDFREIRELNHNGNNVTNYEIEDGYIYLDKDDEGIYKMIYHKLPKVLNIDDSLGTETFELKKEAHHLIPYYMVALMILEDKPEVADVAFQEYERKLAIVMSEGNHKKKPKRVVNTLWGVRQYDQS